VTIRESWYLVLRIFAVIKTRVGDTLQGLEWMRHTGERREFKIQNSRFQNEGAVRKTDETTRRAPGQAAEMIPWMGHLPHHLIESL
jgi:hypothetical protein